MKNIMKNTRIFAFILIAICSFMAIADAAFANDDISGMTDTEIANSNVENDYPPVGTIFDDPSRGFNCTQAKFKITKQVDDSTGYGEVEVIGYKDGGCALLAFNDYFVYYEDECYIITSIAPYAYAEGCGIPFTISEINAKNFAKSKKTAYVQFNRIYFKEDAEWATKLAKKNIVIRKNTFKNFKEVKLVFNHLSSNVKIEENAFKNAKNVYIVFTDPNATQNKDIAAGSYDKPVTWGKLKSKKYIKTIAKAVKKAGAKNVYYSTKDYDSDGNYLGDNIKWKKYKK